MGERLAVSLTMIVRDEEANLPRCLESVRGVFDEIVVVDTGSVDRTAEVAREFGARVFDFVWIDDFAAVWNSPLARACGDYVFWLGTDGEVEPNERAKLEALLGRLRPDDPAFEARHRALGREEARRFGPDIVIGRNEALFESLAGRRAPW